MDNDWPPLEKCAQYKYGMINKYMGTFVWEEKPDDEEGYFYNSDTEREDRKITYKFSELKDFLHQVRTTRGYAVDINPPSFMDTPFWMDIGEVEPEEKKTLELALAHITSKTGKPYKHVKNVKSVYTYNRVLLLTFIAKEEDAGEETFYATAFVPLHALDKESRLLECFIKPHGPAPWGK